MASGKARADHQKSKLAIRYALTMGRTQLFINDSSIDFGNNMVERSIRPIALTRKNALFAASLAEPSREQQSRC